MRRRLLDATVECLVRHGYAGTTTTRVTEIAGVTRGAQVHHFPTRADLVAAAAAHLAAKRAELVSERVARVHTVRDPLDAALDLVWEVHQGPVLYATMEMWVAARTDPELRGHMAEVEPAARAPLIAFTETAFGEYAGHPRFRHALHTAMDAVRGILLMGLSDEDPDNLGKRWRRAKTDLRTLMEAVLPGHSATGA